MNNTTLTENDTFQNPDAPTMFKDIEMYNRICEEFIKMKHNYDQLKNAKLALRSVAQECSSLDNLIKASLNPLGEENVRPRVDSFNHLSQPNVGRKRAMTIDGPTKEKYAHLGASKNSAFSTFKGALKAAPQFQNSISNANVQKLQKDNNSCIKRKRTHLEMKKDLSPQNLQLNLLPNDEFSGRKRARSF